MLAARPSVYLDFNETNSAFRDQITGAVFLNSGTILAHQPGFDRTLPGNTAASIPSNASLTAPANSLGDLEWDKPFTISLNLDRLDLPRASTKNVSTTLFMKGDQQSAYYKLFVLSNVNTAQLCFELQGKGAIGFARYTLCEKTGGYANDLPNGYNYHIVLTNDGKGSPTSLGMIVNGIPPANSTVAVTGYYKNFFGSVSATVHGGSGYADATTFKATGGGPNCNVAGTMAAAEGIPTGTFTFTTNYGCTGTPTLALTNSTGSGAELTATNNQISTSTAQTSPLVLAGSTNKGMPVPNDPTLAPLLFDEFAIIPGPPDLTTIDGLYVHTKFYQTILPPPPVRPLPVVFDNDTCQDTDNLYALALAISLDRLGYIALQGAVSTDAWGPGAAKYRQMLDQAGLTRIPVSVPSQFTQNETEAGPCPTADAKTYDPATPVLTAQYPQATAMYRAILAHATAKVAFVLGGSFRGVMDLMLSPPDSISPLTGAQLFDRKVSGLYLQGGCLCASKSDNTLIDWQAGQYVMSHNGDVPVYFYGGLPQASGPGVLYTRAVKDPLRMMAVHVGSDSRDAFDSLPVMGLVTKSFATLGPDTVNGTWTINGPASATGAATPKSNHFFGALSPLASGGTNSGNLEACFLNALINPRPGQLSREK